MSSDLFLMTISLPLLTAIVVFAMKYASSFAAARAAQAETGAIRALAERSGDQHVQTAASLKAIESDLAQMVKSLTAVETMLKQVG